MGVSPILVVFGAIYHWYPKITGRMYERDARQDALLAAPSSAPTRSTCRCTTSASSACRAATSRWATPSSSRIRSQTMNAGITIVGADRRPPSQLMFLFNLVWSLQARQAGRPQSLGRDDARMADARHAAAARQLGAEAAGRLSLGLRLQRARAPRRTSFRRTSRRIRRCRAGHGPTGTTREPDRRVRRARRRHRRLVACRPPADGQVVGDAAEPADDRVRRRPAWPCRRRAVGLWVFLAVVTSFFGAVHRRLLHAHESACATGRGSGDWRRSPSRRSCGSTRALLVAEQRRHAVRASARSAAATPARAAAGLLAGGVVRAARSWPGSCWPGGSCRPPGYYAASNPANAFFYVLTGAARPAPARAAWSCWAATTGRMLARRLGARPSVRLSVELCAVYWHYLLLVWLVLFGLLLAT